MWFDPECEEPVLVTLPRVGEDSLPIFEVLPEGTNAEGEGVTRKGSAAKMSAERDMDLPF